MRLPDTEHTSRSWEIHAIAHDFRLEDVWEIPVRGNKDDFPQLVDAVENFDIQHSSSPMFRFLFNVRWKLGRLLGWEDENKQTTPDAGILLPRVPEELRNTLSGKESEFSLSTPLYCLENEYATELATKGITSVLHISWVREDNGEHRGQMAALVKPKTRMGALYIRCILPFRRWIVVPQLLRDWAAYGRHSSQQGSTT